MIAPSDAGPQAHSLLFDDAKVSGALTNLQLCIEAARSHKADVSEGEAAVAELQRLMAQKIAALSRLAPAALDATQLLKVLKLASQDRLDACAAELDAAIEAAHEVRLDTVTRPSLGDFYTVTNRGARDGHRSGARSVTL